MPIRLYRHHDVVVVGARAAGAATGLLLARMGHDVAVLERAQFPRDTLSTHSISRSGVVQLARWGLLDQVMASGAPPIRQVTFHTAGASVPATSSPALAWTTSSRRAGVCSTQSSPTPPGPRAPTSGSATP